MKIGKVVSEKNLIKQLANQLIEKKLKVAVAESCTGGMLAQQFTSVSGSSKWFECGFVTYSNASKIRLLEVEANVLNEYGAVSEQVAEQMAIGVLKHSDADISAAITGIAGPGGGTDDKPVGTVYIATAIKNQANKQANNQASYLIGEVIHHVFEGDRKAVRDQSASAAIVDLISRIN